MECIHNRIMGTAVFGIVKHATQLHIGYSGSPTHRRYQGLGNGQYASLYSRLYLFHRLYSGIHGKLYVLLSSRIMPLSLSV
jgi:hypothetical protein